ncbi:minor tail protein [Arthrobacter phage Litotes]|uniref:Minor tail protein n=1 Tax=Arthrobacter phage Litotes TaxID=2499008 RepID=A0A3S9UEL8_9CAUD|nr:minor tail protein [Arthrobacter phage Litotes]AZS08722.1 hypothetical protein SEA_LITOTES_1 [Arthrobacter phage Litotes]
MTIVHFGLRHPSAAGRIQATGRVAWVPTERRVDGSLVVLPAKVSVTLEADASAEIEPGTYLFHEQAVGGVSAYRTVPNAIEVDYSSLVAVDPDTLDPEAQPEAAWYAFVEGLNAANADMLASALSAQHSAELAQLSATGSETSASASALAAEGSATSASNSALAASNSAIASGNARDSASLAQASAAGFASAASGSADAAAGSAATATQKAQTATDKAAEAVAAALGFSLGSVSTVGPSEVASATITGPAGSRVLNLALPRGAVPVFSVLATTTGPETPGTPGMQGQKGDKGDPGGFTLGTALGTMDLNTVTSPGIYRQSGAPSAGLNYPVLDLGVLTVHQSSTVPWVIQEYMPTATLSGPRARVFYRRVLVSGAWSGWVSYSSSRVDQTAGRAIYQWDDLNGREQIVYGDTGWRDIKTLLVNGWTANVVYLRRQGDRCTLKGLTLDGSALTSTTFLNLTSGFRPQHGDSYFQANTISAAFALMAVGLSGAVRAQTGQTMYGSPAYFEISWTTTEAWPTTLPGSASGSIPSA